MKKHGKMLLFFLLFAALLFSISGCFASQSVDNLYTLPQLSEGYIHLQEKINEILADGAEYSSPASGSNRQAVQLEDIDGDGVQEALAFFTVSGDDRPLKIYIFEREQNVYTQAALIEGEGNNFESINYTDMDNDGVREIVVGWQISTDIKMLNVYSIKDYQVSSLVNTDYTRYIISASDRAKQSDILVLRTIASELSGEAILYTLTDDGEIASSSAQLSNGIETVSRVRQGALSDGTSAVFVESVYQGNSMITDVLACEKGMVTNITLDPSKSLSEGTVRSYNIYCTDINEDGIMEVPDPVLLPATSEDTYYWAVDWYQYDAKGEKREKQITYHNFSDGWYLVIPEQWKNKVAVHREDAPNGDRAVVFSYRVELGKYEDFLKIFTFSGERRSERAKINGRFVLLEENGTVYAAQLGKNASTISCANEGTIKENFHMIYTEWMTGET